MEESKGKTRHVGIKVSLEEHKSWLTAAGGPMKLSAWIRETCNAALNEREGGLSGGDPAPRSLSAETRMERQVSRVPPEKVFRPDFKN